MHNISLMAVHNRRQYLLKVLSSHSLREKPSLLDPIKQLPTATVLRDNVIVLLVLKQLIDIDDIGMVQVLQDTDLCEELVVGIV